MGISYTAKRHRMRCSNTRKCGQRFTLKKHPDLYVKDKYICPECGGRAYSDEKNRRNELAKQEQCAGDCCYPFKHRKDSLRMCPGHPLADVDLTQMELHDFDACMATPRSG